MEDSNEKPPVVITKSNDMDQEKKSNEEDIVIEKGSSFWPTVVNMINTVIGAGILAISSSIKNAGIIGSLFCIILTLIPSLATAYYLSLANFYTKEDTYGGIFRKLGSKSLGFLGDLTVLLLDVGVCTAYMVVFFDQVFGIVKMFSTTFVPTTLVKYLVPVILTVVLIIPLSAIKSIDGLKIFSLIAIISVIAFIFCTLYLGINQLFVNSRNPAEALSYNLWPTWSEMGSALSVFVLCFCSHINIPRMAQEIKYTKKSKFASKTAKMLRVNIFAYSACAFAYFVVGGGGYLAYGENLKGNILDNFGETKTWYTVVVKIGYALVVLFSYPIVAYPATNTIYQWITSSPRTTARSYMLATCYCAITLILALVVPDLLKVFGITGATCGTFILLIWPSVMYILIYKKYKENKSGSPRADWFHPTKCSLIWSIAVLVFGIIVCVFATSQEVMNLSK